MRPDGGEPKPRPSAVARSANRYAPVDCVALAGFSSVLPDLCAPPTAPASAARSIPSAALTLLSTSRPVTQAVPTSPQSPATATGFRSVQHTSLRTKTSRCHVYRDAYLPESFLMGQQAGAIKVQLNPAHCSLPDGAAVHSVCVCSREPEPSSPRPMSKRLPTLPHSCHPHHLSGSSDRLHHPQSPVHDGAQVCLHGHTHHANTHYTNTHNTNSTQQHKHPPHKQPPHTSHTTTVWCGISCC